MIDIEIYNYKLDFIIKIVYIKWILSFKVFLYRMKKIFIFNRWIVYILYND